ncbi:FAD-dependent oxidoreductase [Natronobeatus ordinarius]|uniref:FAD-dependent oxidoreductase n=1 Tax=Natronobeatus ordinarius TaxID=2963433 RepID=UPI0020CF8D69|nr:FAD-dependent oxidoreductase [Natronobeatus ordinarius]
MDDQTRVEIYTKDPCPYCEMAKSLLEKKGVAYEEYLVTGDDELFTEMVERANGRTTAPEVFVDGELIGGWNETRALEESGELDELLGLTVADGGTDVEHRNLIIAGTGIAGLTAAIYAGRANNEPLVLEGDEPGGQLTLTTDVANYPGFPEGISGPELVTEMKAQAERFGAEIDHGVLESVERVEQRSTVNRNVERSDDASDRPFRVELTNGDVYTADAIIAASGASARTLGVPGEDELMGYGLSTCATCDGAFFRGEDMLVVGGGDAAMEEAHFLTKFADTVYLAHRREEFRAEQYWIDRVEEKVEAGELEIMKNTELLEVHGSPEDGVDHVTLVHNEQGHPTDRLDDPETDEFDFDVGAVFLAIGHTPNTDYLEDTGVQMDDEGYLRTQGGTDGGQTETDVPGIFGAGDVVDYHYQQAVTAAGMGCKAAIDADAYLEELERADAATETATADD